MRNNPNPTHGQQRVLDFIAARVQERGWPPTYREMASHFGWKSEAAARQHVRYLIQKGCLEKEPGTARGLSLTATAARRDGLRGVPLLGSVPAGQPLDAVEDLEGSIGIDPTLFPEAGVFALRVRGASMIGAGIFDGDLALVRQTPDAKDGDLVVARMDGEATLKRFFLKNGRVVLHAENPDFRDIVVDPDVDFSLAGVVIGVVRRMG